MQICPKNYSISFNVSHFFFLSDKNLLFSSLNFSEFSKILLMDMHYSGNKKEKIFHKITLSPIHKWEKGNCST